MAIVAMVLVVVGLGDDGVGWLVPAGAGLGAAAVPSAAKQVGAHVAVHDGGVVVRRPGRRTVVAWTDVTAIGHRTSGATVLERGERPPVVLDAWRSPELFERVRDAWRSAR